MGTKIKILILFALAQLIAGDRFTDLYKQSVANLKNSENNSTTVEPPYDSTTESSLETDEICTCCPITPAFVNDNEIQIEKIKNQFKADLTKLELEFEANKKVLQDKIKSLENETEPLKVNLREIRKVNSDKESDLKIDEKSERNRMLRKDFKESIDNLKSQSEMRLDAKKRYKYLRDSCRKSARSSDFDNSECKEKLSEINQSVDKANSEISLVLESMKIKHEEIVELENQIKVGEEDLWTLISENHQQVKLDIEGIDGAYKKTYQLQNELDMLGEKYENDQRELSKKSRNELRKFSPSEFSWIPWHHEKSNVPSNAIMGGYDVDSLNFYVVRRRTYSWNVYGKFAALREDAYVTSSSEEYGVRDFDLLVGSNLVWCKNFETNVKLYDEKLPICRVMYGESLIPGTLVNEGCRIGFGYETYFYGSDDGFEILKPGTC